MRYYLFVCLNSCVFVQNHSHLLFSSSDKKYETFILGVMFLSKFLSSFPSNYLQFDDDIKILITDSFEILIYQNFDKKEY